MASDPLLDTSEVPVLNPLTRRFEERFLPPAHTEIAEAAAQSAAAAAASALAAAGRAEVAGVAADRAATSATAAQAVVDAGVALSVQTQVWAALARIPEALIAGALTRNADGAVTAAPVVWPDGTPGNYTADVLSTTFPGAVDAYRLTYGNPATRTYTQPAVTRDAAGVVVTLPRIVIT